MSIENPREYLSQNLMDIESERRLLGILIKHPEFVDTAMEKLSPEHFTDRANRYVFETVVDLYNKNGRISYTQIYNQLRREGSISNVEQALLSLTEAFISPVELEPTIDILVEKRIKKAIFDAANEIQKMVCSEGEYNVSEIQAKAQQLIFNATSKAGEEDVKTLMEVLNQCYLKLLERKEGNKPSGLPVRYPAIDVMTTGFKKKDLIILAARPSMGKTSLALNFVVNVARPPRNTPVLIVSLEMDNEQIGDRLVISELFRYQSPDDSVVIKPMDYATKLSDEQFAQTQGIFNDLYNLPIFLIDKRGLTVQEIRAKARKVKAENPELGLVVIDYLQLIRPAPGSQNRNYTLVVGDIVRELRDLAGELDLPILLLSQLNRAVEQRENKRPLMSDLRDSGNIEEFADVVMFLYREDYYYPEKAREEGTTGITEVIIAKQRKGPTGSCKLRFQKEYTRFIEESPWQEGE
jgi:replicative DNA helicase